MESRIMQVFYGNDCLPYKDSARSVHYPIVGNSFLGASSTTQIRFYVRDIGGVNNVSWVAISKLPNGKIGNQVLADIHLDEELNEYYVALDLSSYYTQLKGDVFISLNGYQGGVQVEEDQETGIFYVVGTPVIEATGSIKLAINYAPQLPLGQHFTINDLQQILGALSEKSNIISTIQVIDDISQADLTGFNVGQILYDLNSKRFYKKTQGSFENYNFVTNNQTSVSIIASPTQNINGREFVHYTSELTAVGGFPVYKIKYDGENTTEEQAREYMSYMTGSSYLPRYNYDRPTNTYFLLPDGQLLKPQYDNTNGLVLFILSKLALESYVEENYVPYTGATKNVNLGSFEIVANHFYKQTVTTNNELTTKGEVDNAISNAIESVKRNSFILVDITQYPTLPNFLASTGEEGYIYLYPINTSDLSQGYQQYIWENNSWLFIGLTIIDLSDYYTKSQTNSLLDTKVDKVAGKGLSTNDFTNAYKSNVDSNTRTLEEVYYNPTTNSFNVHGVINFWYDGSHPTPLEPGGYITIDSDGDGLSDFGLAIQKDRLIAAWDGLYTTMLLPIEYEYQGEQEIVVTLATQEWTNAGYVQKTSNRYKVYGTGENGVTTLYDVDDDSVGSGGIVRRDANSGAIETGDPTDDYHATNKRYVDNAINTAVSSVYKVKGSATVAQINALTNQQVGDVYNLTDSGTITLGNLRVFAGDNIVWTGSAWDRLSNDIDWTAYDEKFIAAGFFEVQPYNENTGEITIVYSTELYIMSYDDNTGVLTISAN